MSAVTGSTTDLAGNFVVTNTYGTLTVHTDGSYSFVANAAFDALTAGDTPSEQFTFTVSDGHTSADQTLTINITGTNDTPVVNAVTTSAADTAALDAGSTVASGNLLATDSDRDAGDTLTVSAVTGSTTDLAGNFVVTDTYGTLTVHTDGSYSFVANAAFDALTAGDTPSEQFTFTVSDGHHQRRPDADHQHHRHQRHPGRQRRDHQRGRHRRPGCRLHRCQRQPAGHRQRPRCGRHPHCVRRHRLDH